VVEMVEIKLEVPVALEVLLEVVLVLWLVLMLDLIQELDLNQVNQVIQEHMVMEIKVDIYLVQLTQETQAEMVVEAQAQ
tara:strand:+ start:127 stop:363 length:237 start_codon:yes stop_codon:yes gene_type:complete